MHFNLSLSLPCPQVLLEETANDMPTQDRLCPCSVGAMEAVLHVLLCCAFYQPQCSRLLVSLLTFHLGKLQNKELGEDLGLTLFRSWELTLNEAQGNINLAINRQAVSLIRWSYSLDRPSYQTVFLFAFSMDGVEIQLCFVTSLEAAANTQIPRSCDCCRYLLQFTKWFRWDDWIKYEQKLPLKHHIALIFNNLFIRIKGNHAHMIEAPPISTYM